MMANAPASGAAIKTFLNIRCSFVLQLFAGERVVIAIVRGFSSRYCEVAPVERRRTEGALGRRETSFPGEPPIQEPS